LRNNSCAQDGSPQGTASPAGSLKTSHFTGLYLILIIFITIAVLCSKPAQAFVSESWRHKVRLFRYYCCTRDEPSLLIPSIPSGLLDTIETVEAMTRITSE
jgi:hypothetical protein